jgi:hypothetical protein
MNELYYCDWHYCVHQIGKTVPDEWFLNIIKREGLSVVLDQRFAYREPETLVYEYNDGLDTWKSRYQPRSGYNTVTNSYDQFLNREE